MIPKSGLFLRRQVESLKTGEPKVNYREQGPTVPRLGWLRGLRHSIFWEKTSNQQIFVRTLLRRKKSYLCSPAMKFYYISVFNSEDNHQQDDL